MKKILNKQFIIALGLSSVVACSANTNQTHTTSQNAQTTEQTQSAQAEQNQGIWIDVRSSDEYQAGHLANAVNISHTDITSQIAKVVPNKDAPIQLYCKSGRRAELARQALIKLGYTNVNNRGGYDELIHQGFK